MDSSALNLGDDSEVVKMKKLMDMENVATISLCTLFLTSLVLGFVFDPTIVLVGSILLALGLEGLILVVAILAVAAWLIAGVTLMILILVVGVVLLAIQNDW